VILRDSFYAHLGDKPEKRFGGPMEEAIEGKFPKNPEGIVFLAICVCSYALYFRANISKEWEEMSKKVGNSRIYLPRDPDMTAK